MRTTRSVLVRYLLTLAAALAVLTANAHAQLVYDGGTTVVSSGSNDLSAGLTVGQYQPSTVLRLESGAVVTVSVFSTFTIGENYGCDSNQVVVSGSGTVLYAWSLNYIGYGGSQNSVLVTNGGYVNGIVSGYSLNSTSLGLNTNSHGNQITVTGTNSQWATTEILSLNGVSNKVLIANGGLMKGYSGFHGAIYSIGESAGANNNQFIVTGTNSKCIGFLTNGGGLNMYVGELGSSNSLLVSNGATLIAAGNIGYDAQSSNNVAKITGSNSVWSGGVVIGINGKSNTLIVERDGVLQGSCVLGSGSNSANNFLIVQNGSLTATGGPLDVRRGKVNFSGGLINVARVLLTNGNKGSFQFDSGTLQTRALTNNNGQPFVVGNGTNLATLNCISNGTHSFADGLLIQTNATLTGTGTINGSVTNCGTIFLTNADQMIFTGPVVNKGVIIAVTGTPRFGSTFTNLGTLITTASINVANVSVNGPDIVLQFNSASNYVHEVQASTNVSSGLWQTLTNGLLGTGSPITFTDPGGALSPNRTYRVLLH